MSDKYFFIFLSICAIVGGSVWVVSEVTKPKLTDPLAQRLWAAGHPKIVITQEQTVELIKKTLETQSDSVRLK